MEPVKWGVLGVADHFVKKMSLPAGDSHMVDVVAVASRRAESARRAAAELGIPRSYGSYEELLGDSEVEAVYIPLPNHLHVEWTKKAADAGKHVLCEKPLGLNAAEVQEAVDHCERRGVLLMEAFMYRFHPQWRYARDLIRTGNIGPVRAVQSTFSYNNPDPNNIRNIYDAGGGGLYDIGCYAVSSARFLMGREPSRVVSLIERHAEWKTDILASAVLDFDGAHATFSVGTQTFQDQHVTALGGSGAVTVELPFNIYSDVPVYVTVRDGIGSRRVAFGPYDQYQGELDAFSEAVRSGASVAPTPPSDALANQRVLDALFASEKSGTWETL
ncbi:MAG: Gfo/Idh/MocA family protein [Spirochaetaceae bacterium]